MTEFPQDERNRIRRLPKRGRYDKDVIYRILDEALICHVGFVQENQPFVIPTIHARLNDELVLHGARASRMLKHVQGGHPFCVTVTLLDGVVLARSVFHHSFNYRSVALFGAGRLLEANADKLAALEAVTEHVAPGRWSEARQPNQKELDATTIVAIPIESVAAKIRTGPPCG